MFAARVPLAFHVFTIGGLYVACVEHYFGKGVSLESYLQAVGKKSTGKASGTQETHANAWRLME